MPLILLTFLAAFLIESIGTYVSVIGLSSLFSANPVIIALAVSLDIGKLVVVTLLYKHWKSLGKLMRTYAFIAAAITMVITSSGAAGYLSSEFQKAMAGTQESAQKIEILKTQEAKYEDRKKQIDAQIAALPEKTTVSNRLRLMNGFKSEQQDLQKKINDLDAQLPALQTAQIGVEAHAGPILVIAKMFGITIEKAVQYVILIIIPVFDPLAVFLLIAGNLLVEVRQKKQPELAPWNGPAKGWEPDDLDGATAGGIPAGAMPRELVTDNMMDEANAPIGSTEWNTAMDKIRTVIPEDATWSVGKDREIVNIGQPKEPAITKAMVDQATVDEFNARLATALGIRQEHEDSESRYERAVAASERIEHEMEQEALRPAPLPNPGLPKHLLKIVQPPYPDMSVPQDDFAHQKTFDDAHVHLHPKGADEPAPEPVVESVPEPVVVTEAPPVSPEVAPEPEREVITRKHLIPQATSSLNAVKADDSVTFHDTPANVTKLYKSLK